MARIILKNQFHGSEVALNAKKNKGTYYISKWQAARARRELCGISDCKCGDEVGQRHMGNNNPYDVVPQLDGSCYLIPVT